MIRLSVCGRAICAEVSDSVTTPAYTPLSSAPRFNNLHAHQHLQRATLGKNEAPQTYKHTLPGQKKRSPHGFNTAKPSLQACGGSAVIWGCCSWSGLGSATLCAERMRPADYLDILTDQVIMFPIDIPRGQRQDSS